MSYKIKFIDHDGKILPVVDENGNEYDEFSYKWGTSGSKILKPNDPSRIGHTFTGWIDSNKEYEKDDDLSTVQEEWTYTPRYSRNSYLVRFVNAHTGELLLEKTLPFETNFQYDGKLPEKESDSEFHYVFTGWEGSDGSWHEKDSIISIEAYQVTYTAHFTPVKKEYKIYFYDIDLSKVLGSKEWDLDLISY